MYVWRQTNVWDKTGAVDGWRDKVGVVEDWRDEVSDEVSGI